MPSSSASVDEVLIVAGDGGDDSGGSVGGCGDDAASGGVFFVDGHGVDGDPVERGERVVICLAAGALALPSRSLSRRRCDKTRGAAADFEASGKNAFGCDAALDAALHDLPDVQRCRRGPRLRVGGLGSQRALVGEHDLPDGEIIFCRDFQQVGGALEWIGLRGC